MFSLNYTNRNIRKEREKDWLSSLASTWLEGLVNTLRSARGGWAKLLTLEWGIRWGGKRHSGPSAQRRLWSQEPWQWPVTFLSMHYISSRLPAPSRSSTAGSAQSNQESKRSNIRGSSGRSTFMMWCQKRRNSWWNALLTKTLRRRWRSGTASLGYFAKEICHWLIYSLWGKVRTLVAQIGRVFWCNESICFRSKRRQKIQYCSIAPRSRHCW